MRFYRAEEELHDDGPEDGVLVAGVRQGGREEKTRRGGMREDGQVLQQREHSLEAMAARRGYKAMVEERKEREIGG